MQAGRGIVKIVKAKASGRLKPILIGSLLNNPPVMEYDDTP
jgi:hypothetical protein